MSGNNTALLAYIGMYYLLDCDYPQKIERITYKNMFFLLFYKFFKRCIYVLSVVLFLCDFNFFHGRRVKAKVLFRKTSWMCKCYLENGFAKVLFWFDVSSKLIRWNTWRSISDSKIQIYVVKAVSMLLGYKFCFKGYQSSKILN